jgi:uncharacterized Tic20 family protein
MDEGRTEESAGPFDAGTGPRAVLSSEDKLWVIVAHLGPLFLSFVAPLVVWLVKRDESEFLADQARESLNFSITMAIAYLVSSVLMACVIGIFLLPAVIVIAIVFAIIAAVKASDGVRYRYPFALRLIK